MSIIEPAIIVIRKVMKLLYLQWLSVCQVIDYQLLWQNITCDSKNCRGTR